MKTQNNPTQPAATNRTPLWMRKSDNASPLVVRTGVIAGMEKSHKL